jgi:2'-hydroxyisoflavone reductase
MRLLVLGGTVFVGRHLVDEALRRGHEVTLFNRGQSNADLFPQVEHLLGERSGDLTPLRGRSFEAVVDTSGYLPPDVRASAELLAGHADRYLFVSSRSVYANTATPDIDEDAPLAELPSDASEDELTGETYGALKALCERAVQQAFGERCTVLRPGLIVGPHDQTNRFGYWPRRVAEGGDVLAPAPPEQPLQVIDVRDLVTFALDLLERGPGGTFSVTTPPGAITFGSLLDTCREAAGSDARSVWVDEAFLLEREVQPWTELPLWTPGADYAGFQRSSTARAEAAGLHCRPLAETVRDTLAWEQSAAGTPRLSGRLGTGSGPLTPERERALLAEWSARVRKL